MKKFQALADTVGKPLSVVQDRVAQLQEVSEKQEKYDQNYGMCLMNGVRRFEKGGGGLLENGFPHANVFHLTVDIWNVFIVPYPVPAITGDHINQDP